MSDKYWDQTYMQNTVYWHNLSVAYQGLFDAWPWAVWARQLTGFNQIRSQLILGF